MSEINCPNCERAITYLNYIEHGTKQWNGEQWLPDSLSSWEYFCPLCNYSLTQDELKQIGFQFS